MSVGAAETEREASRRDHGGWWLTSHCWRWWSKRRTYLPSCCGLLAPSLGPYLTLSESQQLHLSHRYICDAGQYYPAACSPSLWRSFISHIISQYKLLISNIDESNAQICVLQPQQQHICFLGAVGAPVRNGSFAVSLLPVSDLLLGRWDISHRKNHAQLTDTAQVTFHPGPKTKFILLSGRRDSRRLNSRPSQRNGTGYPLSVRRPSRTTCRDL